MATLTHIKYIIDSYKNERLHPGGCIQAAIEGNEGEAYLRADSEVRKSLGEIMYYIHTTLPPDMRGSRENFNRHLYK